jgi:hypothetical protein
MTDESGLRIEHGFEIIPGGAPGLDPVPPDAAASEEARVAARAELQPVVDFSRALAKAVKAARMYPSNNPIYARFQADLLERTRRAFDEFSVVRLVVGQQRLYFQGETVYESADPEDNLARLFFRDGLREVTFHVGLDRDELARFLDMIRGAASRESTEDLVTQLWDQSLSHITYVAIDDILDQGLSDEPVPAEFGSDFMNYVDFELDFT